MRITGVRTGRIRSYRIASMSLTGGIASLLDISAVGGRSRYGRGYSGKNADAAALGEDWKAVGRDLQRAMSARGLKQ